MQVTGKGIIQPELIWAIHVQVNGKGANPAGAYLGCMNNKVNNFLQVNLYENLPFSILSLCLVWNGHDYNQINMGKDRKNEKRLTKSKSANQNRDYPN